MRIYTSLLLLMIVVCTYARTFSAIDIPDPPQIKRDNAEKNNNVQEIRLENKISEIRSPKEASEATSKPLTSTKPPTTPAIPTTPAKTTTTLDPWDEFCKEACEEGLAGPECDCPEHPIGRRSVGNRRHRRSTFIDTRKNDETEPHQDTSKAKPTVNLKVKRLLMKYCKLVCDYGIENDVCKCSGPPNKPGFVDKDPLYNINGSDVVQGNSTQIPEAAGGTTTKDPLEEFCETACSEGQGTLACNCHDHIVGRRRRSLSRSTFRQYQDITHMENALHRIILNRDSVQSQDLSVNFPFRTLPDNIKVHKDKLARVHLHKDSPHNQELGVNFPYKKMAEKKQN